MSQNEFSLDLGSFLENVLSPAESFARICTDSNDGLFIPHTPRAQLMDYGIVVGALTSLSRRQLQEFGDMLQTQIGKIEVTHPRTEVIPSRVCQVAIERQEEQAPGSEENTLRRKVILEFLKENPDLLKGK